MYINELSLFEQNLSKYDIRRVLSDFIELFVAYFKITKRKDMYLYKDSALEFIYNEYKIVMWLNDPEVDRETRRLFLSIKEHIKYFDEIAEAEALIFGNGCKACVKAYIDESILISFFSAEKWNKNELQGTYNYFDSDGEFLTEIVKVPNVVKKDHLLDENVLKILKRLNQLPIDYLDLWEQRAQCFPNIVFCESIKDNFEELESAYFNQIIRKLIDIDTYFSQWDGIFEKDKILNCSPESESTLQEYKNQHEFFAPNGRLYLSSWHVRFTGIGGRIYFEPYYEDNKCLICYIGKKLPNKKYPT